MKKSCVLILMLLVFATLKAQITKDPVLWTCKTVKMNDHKYKIYIEANIESGWHIYSQHQPKDAISTPTSFVIGPEKQIKAIGRMKEIGKVEKQDIETLGITQNYFAKKVSFEQEFAVNNPRGNKVSIKIAYMACNDHSCLPVKEIEVQAVLPKN